MLHNYRNARRIMACAYLFFAAGNVAEYFSRAPVDNVSLTQMVTLVIGCSQSFLFTYVFITLINPAFLTARKIIRATLVLPFIACLFAVYFVTPEGWFSALFTVYSLFYVFLLIRFTRLFLAHYRRYHIRMDNYYAGEEAQRLRWVFVSFFAALTVGVLALLSALFMSELGALLFSVALIAFYAVFGIHFLNYPFMFRYIEKAMEEEPAAESAKIDPQEFADIEERINKWVAAKKFTENGITLERLAQQIYTNRTYVSAYINSCKKQTFRNWMNDLRIKEAMDLLVQRPEMTVGEIADRVGFLNQSNFGRQFLKQTGISPDKWRQQAKRNSIMN
jgi:AraC-like DNA-binding protein